MIEAPENSTLVQGIGFGEKVKLLLKDAARTWKLSEGWILVIMLLPLFLAFSAAILSAVNWELYRWFTGSKGLALTEFVPILIWYFDLILCFVVIRRMWGVRERFIAMLYLVLIGSFVMIIGDKINWGQTLFGANLTTAYAAGTQGLQSINNPSDLIEEIFRWMLLLVGAYGTILPLAILRWKVPTKLRKRLSYLIPHYTLIPYFFLIFIWRLYRNFIFPFQSPNFRIVEYNEIMDLVLSLGFFFFLIFQLKNLGKSTTSFMPTSTDRSIKV